MKFLKSFNESQHNENIHNICNLYGIENYTINKDDSIDVDGNVHLRFKKDLTKLPLKFKNVSGKFYCNNIKLESLEGCPKYVYEDFYCFQNNLTSLEGGPESVNGSFVCFNNKLITLKGAPKSVGGAFSCQENQLASLEGAPEYVGGDFACSDNNIRSFDNIPKSIGGNIFITGNPIFQIWVLFQDFSKIELFNYYDIIRDDHIIILDRLECFLDETNHYLYNWNKKAIVEEAGYKFV